MPPGSSLIFVVILAVWAVYLVQHWVRRRDHLATARSVDRFSESMRVLERRRALPRPDLSEPAPRSYTVSPLRPARPQVVVKRGDAAPLPAGATAVGPSAAYRRARTAAQLRAALLLLGSAALVTLVGLALGGVLQTWWIFVGIGVQALAFYGVRWSVSRSRRRARPGMRRATTGGAGRARATGPAPVRSRSSAPAPAQPAAPTGARVHTPTPARGHVPAAVATTTSSRHAFASQSVAATTRTARRSVRPVLYDIDQVEASLHTDAAPPVAAAPGSSVQTGEPRARPDDAQAEPAAGTWHPVPVPPPTYTLKARAHRGSAAPATGSAQLPADGSVMALEEEFEDLPRIGHVG